MKNTKILRDDNIIDCSRAAQILGISTATVRNWVNLGKLSASSSSPLRFSKRDVEKMHTLLESSGYLKARRNKSRFTGNFIPRSYIDKNSPNASAVTELLSSYSDTGVSVDVSKEAFELAAFLMAQRGIPKAVAAMLLPKGFNFSSHRAWAGFSALTFVPGEDLLGMVYLSLRKLRDKKSTGAYYTPFFVADRIIENTFFEIDKKHKEAATICDPGCGTGNFLIRLPSDVSLDHIYGFDIDQTAVMIARINLALSFGISTPSQAQTIIQNIRPLDFLLDRHIEIPDFDIILGNPPWGYSFDKSVAGKLSEIYSCPGSKQKPESFALFIERSFQVLKKDGLLNFILPETMLGSDLYRDIRKLILEKGHVVSLQYLGDVFDKVQCPSVILKISLSLPKSDRVKVCFCKARALHLSDISSFEAGCKRLTSDSFHLLCNEEEFQILQKIESVPHFTLKGHADFALGIVTGSNSALLQDAPSPKAPEPIVLGKDIKKFGIRPASKFIFFDPEHFQQCPHEQFFRAKEKLFYRFIANEPVVALDSRGRLSLNSANIIIPKVPGYSATFIMAVLNSGVISFYYKRKYRNLKVLRSALESLPIPKCSPEKVREIEDLVRSGNYEKLDETIANCYLLPQFKVL